MIVAMPVIMAAAIRVVMTATALVARLGLVPAALPIGEQYEEKAGGEHKDDDDERVHNRLYPERTLGRAGLIVERAPGERGRSPPAALRHGKALEIFSRALVSPRAASQGPLALRPAAGFPA